MWKRLLAALVAVVLAGVGVVLVMAYANRADDRALEGMETRAVLVAVESIPEGTAVEELGDSVQLQDVPRNYLVDGSMADLDQVEGERLSVAIAAGEQLQRSRFLTPEAMRASGDFQLPDEAARLHQITVPVAKHRAIGGNLTAGDKVAVFVSFDELPIGVPGGLSLEEDATGVRRVLSAEASAEETSPGSWDSGLTALALETVLVTNVEGGYVAPVQEDETGETEQSASETLGVTLALSGADAERLVYMIEFGRVWLSLEPEPADSDGIGPVTRIFPNEARNVLE